MFRLSRKTSNIDYRRRSGMNMDNELLTEEILAVNLMQSAGKEITPRLIGDWRRMKLLPPFDEIGKGLGRSEGKAKSGWRVKQPVIDQALWILRLRKLYKTTGELYFPLWVLGFPIPNDFVYEALCYPVEFLIEDLDEMANDLSSKVDRNDRLIEDVISDAVIALTPMYKVLRSIGGTAVPHDAVEAGISRFDERGGNNGMTTC